MNLPLLAGVCAAIFLGVTSARAADTSAGESYFNKKCAVCHGRKAKGMASFPSLENRDAEYLSGRLETYRARGKVGSNSALMYSHAGKLSDDDIANIAGYLEEAFGAPKAGLQPEKPEAEAEEAKPDPASIAPAPEEADKPKKTERIACAQEQGEAMGKCAYRAERDSKGRITVTAIFPNGFKRMLFFEEGKFLKASATMSGVGTDTDWRIADGLHMIRVDDQRYEIPDVLLAASEEAAADSPEPQAEPVVSASKPAAADTSASEEANPTADIAWGKKHFGKNCRGCHGSKAQGVASYPRLAGQPAEYLTKRLKQYRSGERLGPNTPLMAPRAKKLSDEDIRNIVAYIGTFD